MDPDVVAQVAPIIASKSGGAMWVALLIVLVPVLDNLLAEGKFPYAVKISTRVRLALISVGGATVSALQLVQNGTGWMTAISTGAFAIGLAVLRNGTTLFPQKTDGTPGSVKPPSVPLLALATFAVLLAACVGSGTPAVSPAVQTSVTDLVKCALPKIAAGVSVEQTAIECGSSELALVEALASGLHAARKVAPMCAPSATSR